ncbi:protein LIAT1 [Gadus macrocephalus]|uniref:protein LIAT1 n=1 Tax=Gadus macrocephalus TaxID=80720 RepID=UPI0028CB595B|nr:protein LIAT1 [Gadus macrocephalus]
MLEVGSHMEGNSNPPLRNTEARERKKTRRRRRRKTASVPTKSGHSISHLEEDKDNPGSILPPSTLSVSLPPLPGPGPPQALKGRDKEGAPHWSNNPPPLASPTTRGVPELSAQARGSLRWEGELDDPLAEGERLELYKARRRQRYLALRPV